MAFMTLSAATGCLDRQGDYEMMVIDARPIPAGQAVPYIAAFSIINDRSNHQQDKRKIIDTTALGVASSESGRRISY
jgi:hypothetical protein